MTNIDTTDNIKTDGIDIEKVTNYKYLGQKTAMENRIKQEIFIRIKARWSVLESTENSFWTGTFPLV